MITVIMIEPENEGNVGAIARVMANFGFADLLLINPLCDITNDCARGRAMHGRHVLDNARSGGDGMLDDFDYLVATTAKLGSDYNIPRSPVKPSVLGDILSGIDSSSKIGLVIGRESNGLTNQEIERCDFLCAIPADPKYPTMNVSHAVAILLYEIFIRSNGTEMTGARIVPAGKKEKDAFFKELGLMIDNMDFSTEEKRDTQRIVWKKIIGKSMLSQRELFALFGFLRKIKGDLED